MVMRAISRKSGQVFVVKMIQRSPFKAKGSDGQKMFLHEISIPQELDHFNICRLQDAFEDEDAICAYFPLFAGAPCATNCVFCRPHARVRRQR
jgi:hypothetical protein